MPDIKDKVVYQIYPRSFKDSNGDGIGDLNGITEKLDYLRDLGVDYIWITPFFPSPQRDNGYDVSDYRDIDPVFGTMEDFENLVREADKRNIGLMLDMVFNHTSTEHEWFKMALMGYKKYQDYYIFRDGRFNGYIEMPPTNWESKFGGEAWAYAPEVGKWYLHLFDVTQADLNWDNPDVRNECKEIIKFWKAKGVKGFRFDVVNLISKAAFEDDLKGDGRKYYTDGPRVHEFLKELVADSEIGNMITVGEMSSTSLDNCIRYSGAEEKELAMCFHFQHLKVDYLNNNKWRLKMADLDELKEIFASWQEGMQAGNAWDALFWDNHDQPRAVSRFGNESFYWKASAKMLAMAIHLMRGTPYIYQGDELGQTNAHFTQLEQYRDVESMNYYDILRDSGYSKKDTLCIIGQRSRDNGRTPVQWSDDENAGFTTGTPWIPVTDNYKSINAKSQIDAPDSIYTFYRTLIVLRKKHRIISEGRIDFIKDVPAPVLAYVRSFDGRKLYVYCNLEMDEQTFDVPPVGEVLISNMDNDNVFTPDGKLVLSPYGAVAYFGV